MNDDEKRRFDIAIAKFCKLRVDRGIPLSRKRMHELKKALANMSTSAEQQIRILEYATERKWMWVFPIRTSEPEYDPRCTCFSPTSGFSAIEKAFMRQYGS